MAAWVPAAEGVADGEDTFFGAGTFFVATRPAQHGVVSDLGDGFHQRHGLQRITGAVGAFLQVTAVDPILHVGDSQAEPMLIDDRIPELNHLREVMPRIHVQQLNRRLGRVERAARQFQHHAGILPAGKQQANLVELPRHLTDDVDRLVF